MGENRVKLSLFGAAAAAAMLMSPTRADVTGEYVEARSAAVHAGACHYNGELTTAGREAVLAWNVHSGTVGGVRVDGLGVVAVVAGSDNLADAKSARRTVLYVDSKATPAQRKALVEMATRSAKSVFGTVAAIKSAPFRFVSEGKSIKVTAGDAATVNVSKYPCTHCVMPAQTWYKPLIQVEDAVVAQGVSTGFKDATLGITWSHEASDNVYVGTFTL